MESRTKLRQDWLLPYENPLRKKLGDEFFARLPKTPGVYQMIGTQGQILYVGKAKNLRNRLRSYRNARPHEVSRKVIRMINRVAEIRWQSCDSEERALLRENELLREARPPFNVVNTRPEAYLFIGLKAEKKPGKLEVAFQVTTHPESLPENFQAYGAYKGGGTIRQGVLALLRLLWSSEARMEDDQARFDLPSRILGHRVPSEFLVRLTTESPDEWISFLHRFLKGTSPGLLPRLAAALLDNPEIPPFYYRMMQEDLERLREFYARGPRRHRRLVRFRGRAEGQKKLKLEEARIEQTELDDLLVRYQFRGGKAK